MDNRCIIEVIKKNKDDIKFNIMGHDNINKSILNALKSVRHRFMEDYVVVGDVLNDILIIQDMYRLSIYTNSIDEYNECFEERYYNMMKYFSNDFSSIKYMVKEYF